MQDLLQHIRLPLSARIFISWSETSQNSAQSSALYHQQTRFRPVTRKKTSVRVNDFDARLPAQRPLVAANRFAMLGYATTYILFVLEAYKYKQITVLIHTQRVNHRTDRCVCVLIPLITVRHYQIIGWYILKYLYTDYTVSTMESIYLNL